jgi:hypothetical protein
VNVLFEFFYFIPLNQSCSVTSSGESGAFSRVSYLNSVRSDLVTGTFWGTTYRLTIPPKVNNVPLEQGNTLSKVDNKRLKQSNVSMSKQHIAQTRQYFTGSKQHFAQTT